jgi:hypothetical protein
MNESIEKLQNIGVEKIYKDTHIPREFIQPLLEGDFTKFTKLQFLGFITILEREYDLDLESLKEQGLTYFKEKEEQGHKEVNTDLFLSPKQQKNFVPYILIFVAFILLLGAYFSFNSISNEDDTLLVEEVAPVSIVQENKKLIQEINTTKTQELNQTQEIATQQEEKKPEAPKDEAVATSFVIKPLKRLWMGYIDVSNFKHYQKTFSTELALDPKKEWLLTLGHGYFNAVINGKEEKFRSSKNLKFHYKDGVLKKVSREEFKKLNRGRTW